MINISHIVGKLRAFTYKNTGEINIYFEGSCENNDGSIPERTIAFIRLYFQKDYNKKIKLMNDILGFARLDYEYSYDEAHNELVRTSDEKCVYIDICEDIEKFETINKMIKDNSVISVTVHDYGKDIFDVIEGQYQWQKRINDDKDISKEFLKVTSYMNEPDKLDNVKEKYYPIVGYSIHTEYNMLTKDR